MERVAALPGVSHAASRHWFSTGHRATRHAVRDRRTNADAGSSTRGYFIAATPDFFRDDAERPCAAGARSNARTSPASAAWSSINETLATALFPSQDPIGRRLRLINPEQSNEWRTIVGVVGDIKYQGLDSDSAPAVYTPFAQTPFLWLLFHGARRRRTDGGASGRPWSRP